MTTARLNTLRSSQGLGLYRQPNDMFVCCEEPNLIGELFTRLQQAEMCTFPKDAQTEARINEHLVYQPAVCGMGTHNSIYFDTKNDA